MKYTQRLLQHPLFLQLQRDIKEYEKDRIYCHHELSHLLDVCRMAWILYLEHPTKLQIPTEEAQAVTDEKQIFSAQIKDRIYVAGLLHDIGRVSQYQTGEHHAAAGVAIAKQILNDLAYPTEWKAEVLSVIATHNGRSQEISEDGKSIICLIRKADHLSRNCFLCEAADSCKWKEQERNQGILL